MSVHKVQYLRYTRPLKYLSRQMRDCTSGSFAGLDLELYEPDTGLNRQTLITLKAGFLQWNSNKKSGKFYLINTTFPAFEAFNKCKTR